MHYTQFTCIVLYFLVIIYFCFICFTGYRHFRRTSPSFPNSYVLDSSSSYYSNILSLLFARPAQHWHVLPTGRFIFSLLVKNAKDRFMNFPSTRPLDSNRKDFSEKKNLVRRTHSTTSRVRVGFQFERIRRFRGLAWTVILSI